MTVEVTVSFEFLTGCLRLPPGMFVTGVLYNNPRSCLVFIGGESLPANMQGLLIYREGEKYGELVITGQEGYEIHQERPAHRAVVSAMREVVSERPPPQPLESYRRGDP